MDTQFEMARRMPTQCWDAAYSASRRKHHHRCRVCNRILKDGESVIMLRVQHGTKAIHRAVRPAPAFSGGFLGGSDAALGDCPERGPRVFGG